MLNNKSYIKDESLELPLFYPRHAMTAGDKITGFKTNKDLINGLKTCNYIVADMYWKPIGDSFLFLSTLQAAQDYLKIIRPENLPKWVIDSKFANLVQHIDFLKNAKVVENGLKWFRGNFDKYGLVLVTDEDVFNVGKYNPIFNSEAYKYPKFVELDSNKKTTKEYPSRPARYYLTFEREVGTILKNPNASLPDFVMKYQKDMSKLIKDKYKVNIDDKSITFISLISQTSKVEKKFGLLKYLKLAKLILKERKAFIFLFVNSHEESPEIWLKAIKKIEKLKKKVAIIDTEDFEETAYILARCKLTVGNDTGFSHLAAMSKIKEEDRLNPVFIIYAKHDYGKWSTGKNNVHPISTKLADFLTKNSMSVRRDKLNQDEWGDQAWAYKITTQKVFDKIRRYL